MLSIVILTSSKNRHKFFVNSLAEKFEVRGVVVEEKRPEQTGNDNEEDQIISKHFEQRRDAEKKYFGAHDAFRMPSDRLLVLENGKSNDLETFEWVKERNPDFVVLFGTSIIRPPLLSYYDKRMINIHLGLSPYYRGSGTNFWPLVNGEPECVGATIHLAIEKVDAGSILAQVRPAPESDDGCHDMGCKTIIAGAQKMIACIDLYSQGGIAPKEQDLSRGSVYKRVDFHAQAVERMWKNFETGMMLEYVKNKSERDALFPIIEL